MNYLIVTTHNENYALPIDSVAEVLPIIQITRVPEVPEFLRGIILLRGKIIPIIDFNRIIQLPLTQLKFETRILLLKVTKKNVIGMIVNKIERIEYDKNEQSIQRILRETNLIKGFYISEKQKIQVVDPSYLLSPKEKEQLMEFYDE